MKNETGRIEAFSDGVFSIAATLLVLDLKPPPMTTGFWHGIVAQWPGFAAFLLSFLYIGIMWINHHRLFSRLRRGDDLLMTVNLLLLLGVVWIPYPTSLIALNVGTARLRDAAILYNGSYLAMALLYNLLLITCAARGLVDRTEISLRSIARRYAAGPFVYAVCFVLSWWNVPLSLAINGVMALFFLVSPDENKAKS
jgi:uncharacterized membrane protein